MPGEEANAAVCAYLQGLEAFDDKFPGFEHEIHGIGTPTELPSKGRPHGIRYWAYCLPAADARKLQARGSGEKGSRGKKGEPFRDLVRRT